ncbi:hypothetical protein [Jiangella asiatica]|uniref:Serine kinase n=1 Tax=Jiangella asiatica TaxID=2530372 RepID=A0A4R5CFP6_9ACTN|nr:hypothetical protein [Jiangella asiatica]TDD98948.1 hypothetical protein E1269_28115 [Jiangella asiatica]
MSMARVLDVLGVQVEVPADGDGSPEAVYGAAALIAIERSTRLLLHAGAVALDGRAVLFPGASGTGKSTTVAACVRRGLGYLSDEMVALDLRTGAVEGWARPVMLTPWAIRTMGLPGSRPDEGDGKAAVPCDALGGAVVAGAVPVAHVVGLRRGGAETTLTPMPAGEVLAQLLAASFNHYRHGAAAWEAAAVVAGQARGWWLDVADVHAAAEAVAGLPYSPA